MTPVFQTVVDAKIGNCMQAAWATLLDLPLTAVPNYILHEKHMWFDVFIAFMKSLGWKYNHYGYLANTELREEDSMNGYFYASVPSKTFETGTHAVIIDINGIVVHDPNPNQAWLGENVKESGKILYWYKMEKICAS